MVASQSSPVRAERLAEAELPTSHGCFRVVAYADANGLSPVALVHGDLRAAVPLVRVHSECLTGEVLGSLRCDCGPQLDLALERIAAQPTGVLVYLRQEGRGIGLGAKIRAYALQDQGLDTYDANVALGYPPDARDYGMAAAILRDLGVTRLRLLTNNPDKGRALAAYGISVVEELPHAVTPNPHNHRYLTTKMERFGHRLACVLEETA